MTSTAAVGAHPGGRPLRRDAARNRLRVLDAARRVCADRGLDVGFEEIAREAGVGTATVHRRFPERDDLVEALFDQDLDEVAAHLERAVAHPDPGAALRAHLLWSVEAQARDRGLAQVLAEDDRGGERVRRGRARLGPATDALVARAQRAGALRADVGALDLLVPVALCSRVGGPEDAAVRERLVALLVDGLAVRRERPTPLPTAELVEAHLAAAAFPSRPPAPRGPR